MESATSDPSQNGSGFFCVELSTESICEDETVHSDIGRGFAAACLIIISIVGFAGNLASTSVTRQNRYLMRHFGVYLINLCVVSMVISAVILPCYIGTVIANGVVFSDEACILASYFNYSLFLALLSNCVIIALLRCLLLTRSQKIVTRRWRCISLICLWIVPFTLGILGINYFGFNKNQLHCIFSDDHDEWSLFLLLAVPTLVSLSAICVCYVLIYRKVRSSRNKLRFHKALSRSMNSNLQRGYNPFVTAVPRKRSLSCPSIRETIALPLAATSIMHPPEQNDISHSMTNLRIKLVAWSDIQEREMKLTIQLVVNVTLFCVLWTPLMILYGIEDYVTVPPSLWLTFSILGRTFTGLDWIIYNCWTAQQRQAFARMIKNWYQCSGNASQVNPQDISQHTLVVTKHAKHAKKLPTIPHGKQEDEEADSGDLKLDNNQI